MSPIATESFDLTTLLPGPRYCAGCADRVCARLRGEPGVVEARCDLDEGGLTVTYDPRKLPLKRLELLVRRHALEESGAVGHAVYRLEGLD